MAPCTILHLIKLTLRSALKTDEGIDRKRQTTIKV